MNTNNDKKICNGCGKTLSLNDFYKNKHSSDGYTSRCKKCMKKYYQNPVNKERRKAYQKKYYEDNKEKIKQYVKQYDATHPENTKEKRRVKVSNRRSSYGHITKAQWEECLLFFDNLCAYSGEEFSTSSQKDALSLDHIVPVDRGGSGFPWNVVPAKQSYNTSKGTQDMYDWYITQNKFSVLRLLKIEAWKKYAYNKWGYLEQRAM